MRTHAQPFQGSDRQAEEIRARIRQNRMGKMRVAVKTPEGAPLADTRVVVGQVRHQFLFGCNLFGLGRQADARQEAAYRRRFSALLNFATVPFYWSGYEPEEGITQAGRLAELADWSAEHGLTVKGHPLCYHMTVPEWAKALPLEEFRRRQFDRITREVSDFAGRIDVWDVINEAVYTPGHEEGRHPLARVCRRLGRTRLVRTVFDLAHQANPDATLLINDCDPSPAYARVVRDSLAAGAPIDVVGIQSHMHKGYWSAEKTWRVCETFARFGRPLHFSELTILSGIIQPDHSWSRTRDDWFSTPAGEAQQARQVEETYRLLFSHPAVRGITWWDFSDHGAWLGAPAGLLRKDMSPKPAYDALLRLIKGEWWSGEQSLRTDARGRVDVEGFLGDYRMTTACGTGAFALARAGSSSGLVRLARR